MHVSLTNRLTAFFLISLAIVLTAFSLAIFFSVRLHLNQQLEDRAAATLETLLAASEVHPHGLEWKPDQHKIQFWHEDRPTIWAVFDETGKMMDSSRDLTFPAQKFSTSSATGNEIESFHFDWMGERWRIFQMRLKTTPPPTPPSKKGIDAHKEFVFMTAWPLKSITYSLNYLKWTTAFASLAAWVVAAVLGHWLSKQALLPLIEMTENVSRINANQLSYRLQSISTNDELESLSRAFNELMDRLEDSFSRQSRFTSEASHQMRTPLAAMMGQIEVALRRDRSLEEYKRVLSSARAQTIRLQKIVELLLFLARTDAEASMATTEETNVSHWLVEHIESHWRDHARHAQMHVHLPDSGPVMLQTHVAMLGQAVDNYIDNALKYSRPGSPIHIFLEERDNIVSIIVQDEGQGINPEEMSEVFSPFFRSNEARSRGVEGFGLGLAIVARLTQALSGECSVSSKPGQGSRFILTFNKNTMFLNTNRSKRGRPTPELHELDHFLAKGIM